MLALLLGAAAMAAELEPLGKVEFRGSVAGAHDLSAVQALGSSLAIASDETAELQVLEKTTATRYEVTRTIPLLPGASTEIDIEALALDGRTLYVLGSHSWVRGNVKSDKSQAQNRRRLATVDLETSRDQLLRFDLDPAGEVPAAPEIQSKSLRPLLANHPVLRLFARTPGKENGIDFEGLGVSGGRLYLGLRGPVLRGNYVPVLSFAFDDVESCSAAYSARPEGCRLIYVDLGGHGIRSLHRVRGGFLIVSGPMGDGEADYKLYLWDGRDCVLDRGARPCGLELLGEIPTPDGTKAEGLTVLTENTTAWEILIAYDGSDDGARFRAPRP